MAFWLGFMTGIGAVCLICLIALAVLLHGDVRAEDAVEASSATASGDEVAV
jgi:hypothetical protein